MKALVYEGPGMVSLRDVPRPEPGEGEVLVRVEAVGICGSDLHAFKGNDSRRPAPLILGHEPAGVIETGVDAGLRVAVSPLIGCGECPMCAAGRANTCAARRQISIPPHAGAFAQYVVAPRANCHPVPPNVPLTQAALAEPMAVCWHAVRLADEAWRAGSQRRALVLGGGAIGLGLALCLRAWDWAEVSLVEPMSARRAILQGVPGINVLDQPPGDAFDLVADAVGTDTSRATASARTAPGGTILHVGLGGGSGGLDVRRMTLSEITLIATYAFTPQDFKDAANALFAGRFGDLSWSRVVPMSDGPAALAALAEGREASPKLILAPWRDPPD